MCSDSKRHRRGEPEFQVFSRYGTASVFQPAGAARKSRLQQIRRMHRVSISRIRLYLLGAGWRVYENKISKIEGGTLE